MRRVAPIPAQLALVLLVLLQPLRGAEALPACSLAGAYFYQADASVVITFAADGGGGGGGYTLSCSGSCGWSRANVSVDTLRPWSPALFIAFDNGVLTQAWALAPCSAQRVIYFGGSNVGAPWCAVGNAACAVPVDPLWTQPGARVHLAEVSHSDIFWLGSQDDVEIDATNINASLALMLANPRFVWQHECILFLRVYVEMYPEAEAALLARIAEGRFDIGGTFTEGFESTMVNEILARQMYLGRKWFVERYPGLDSAVVAFHQDGPLRAIQMPQVYAKAGMKYMKPSRLSEDIVFWAGLDGASGLVSFPQWQYCEGASQWAIDAQDVLYKMALFAPQYAAAGLPPIDSLNMWPLISGANSTSPRTEIVAGSDSSECNFGNGTTVQALVRSDGWKLIIGSLGQNVWSGPISPNGTQWDDVPYHCGIPTTPPTGKGGCLFNVLTDPTEHDDVAASNPGIVAEMYARILEHQKTAFTPNRGRDDGSACRAAMGQWQQRWGPFLP
jgi:hypothetical protein